MRASPFRPDRIVVATERCIEYTALSTGCNARRALLTALGVTARFTARPGCIAWRTLRGTSSLGKKPTLTTLNSEIGPAEGYAVATASNQGRPGNEAGTRARGGRRLETTASLVLAAGPGEASGGAARNEGAA